MSLQQPPPNHEFDKFIEKYRENQNVHVTLSGESGSFFAQYKAQKLYVWFPQYRNKAITILDFGCGDGLMTELVYQTFPLSTVLGIDPSAKSIEFAQQSFAHLQFFWFDGTTSHFAAESMDLIFAAGVFHHIPFDQHTIVMKEIFRLLKPGGQFVLFELNPFNPLTQITFRRSPVDDNATMLYPHYARSLCATQGTVLKTKYYCFFPRFARRLRFLEQFMTWCSLGALYAIIMQKQ